MIVSKSLTLLFCRLIIISLLVRAGALEFLEAERMKFLGTYAVVIQTLTRRFIIKSKYTRYRQALVKLQAHYRRILKRRVYLNWRQAAVRIHVQRRR